MKPRAIDPLNPALEGLLKRNPRALEALIYQRGKEAEQARRAFCKLLGIDLSQFPSEKDIPPDLWFRIGQAFGAAQRRAQQENRKP
jgi:hypothetical protein